MTWRVRATVDRLVCAARSLALAIALSLAGGCGDATGPVRDGPVVVTTKTGALVIRNVGLRPLYTFTVERSVAALINWAPCTDPRRCEGIERGEHREVSYAEIYGYTPDTREILVYAWDLVRGENGFSVGTMHVVVVRV
jgi:hypothetical protein